MGPGAKFILALLVVAIGATAFVALVLALDLAAKH
jgi:hypothetical protein